MSWLGDRTGIHINSINDITSGRAIKEAARNPLVQMGVGLALPGVGSALGAVAGKAAGAVASKIPGLGSAASKIGGVVKGLPLGGLVKGGGSDGKGQFGFLGDLGGMAKGFLPGGGGLPGMGGGFGGGANGLSTALQQVNIANLNNRANSLQDRAVSAATDPYNAKAGIRGMALSGLATPNAQRPNLSGVFAGSPNPYLKAKQIPRGLPLPGGK